MDKDLINDRTYFYYDECKSNVRNQILENELNVLINNFDSLSFDLVRFLQNNGEPFFYNHPNNHPNLKLNLLCNSFQYHYSFPFSHHFLLSNPQYYEFLSLNDLNNKNVYQYWRPYFSINNQSLVSVKKFNINLNNYMLDNNLHFKIYNILKLQIKK